MPVIYICATIAHMHTRILQQPAEACQFLMMAVDHAPDVQARLSFESKLIDALEALGELWATCIT